MAIRVAIIGCGLIGKKRAAALTQDNESQLLWAVDIDPKNTAFMQSNYKCRVESSWENIVSLPDVDVVIISTPNHLSAHIAKTALLHKKHILVEKPFGRNVREAKSILETAQNSDTFLVVKTGFNHRFHPGIYQAKQLLDEGTIGSLYSMRACYGHGGRKGMEKEWRASADLCGGGELLDQGTHLIDLMQWFGKNWTEVYGVVDTCFWPIEVEDNAYVLGKTNHHIHALFHVSWTHWKNKFSFELFGEKGSMHIQGLGGSYGQEKLDVVLRKPEGGPPKIQTFSYPEEDISWKEEWKAFKEAILHQKSPIGDGFDGYAAHCVIDAIRQSHIEQKRIGLHA